MQGINNVTQLSINEKNSCRSNLIITLYSSFKIFRGKLIKKIGSFLWISMMERNRNNGRTPGSFDIEFSEYTDQFTLTEKSEVKGFALSMPRFSKPGRILKRQKLLPVISPKLIVSAK
jgi:hypothetical protein